MYRSRMIIHIKKMKPYSRLGGMVSALVPGASGPGSSPGRGHCVVFLGMIIHLNCLSKISEKDVPLEVFLASLPSINYEKTNTTFAATVLDVNTVPISLA